MLLVEALTMRIIKLLRQGAVLVAATAGAGKTTLIVRCIKESLTGLGDRYIQVMAFNVSAANEIAGRCILLRGNIRINTVQAVWEAAFRHFHPGLRRVTPPTRDDILAWALDSLPPEVRTDVRVVQRLRMRLEGMIRSDLSPKSVDHTVMLAMAEERHRRRRYDGYDVEAWVRAYPELVVRYLVDERKVALLFVDEAQDLSRTEWGVIAAWIRAGLVVLAVGDTDQTINVFRGADATGMERLISEHAVELVDLPITWRAHGVLGEYEGRLRAALFPGSPKLIAACCGGIGARTTVHRGTKDRAARTVQYTVVAEVVAALGVRLPRELREGLPTGYDTAYLQALASYGLRDIAVLVATNEEAKKIREALESCGVPVTLLTGRRPDPLSGSAARIVLSALDPWGKTSDYPSSHRSLWLRCLLEELAKRKSSYLRPSHPVGRALATHLAELAGLESEGPDALLRLTRQWLQSIESARPGGTTATFLTQARRVLTAVFDVSDDAAGTRHLLEEICAAYDLHYKGSSEKYAVAEYALGLGECPLEAARRVRQWPTASTANELAPLAEGETRVVVAVINQVKGLTFEATWLCALRPKTFPYKGRSAADEERCRYWVASTRATDLLIVHVHMSDAYFAGLAGPVDQIVGESAGLTGSWSGSPRLSRS